VTRTPLLKGELMGIAGKEVAMSFLSMTSQRSPFDDLDDLVRVANDTVYGMEAGIWTCDIGKVHRMAEALRAGTVWINCYNVFDAALSRPKGRSNS
jgi:acyl-CoA reductase-like NAD-dependent aldehyde dehydrogenase